MDKKKKKKATNLDLFRKKIIKAADTQKNDKNNKEETKEQHKDNESEHYENDFEEEPNYGTSPNVVQAQVKLDAIARSTARS